MSVDSTGAVGRASLFVWQVSADQEEPWRRFLQELSGSRFEEYAASRRRLGISAESVWLTPKPTGGGVAIVFLEAEDSERALRELVADLAASKTSFDSWFMKGDARALRSRFRTVAARTRGELLFAWREVSGEGEQEEPP